MKNLVKVAFLTSITTAAIVYVLLEWRPLRSAVARAPEVTWAEGGAAPSPASPAAAVAADSDEENNIEIYKKYSQSVVNIASTTLALNWEFRPVPVEAGTGSGAIIDEGGHIVTNFHVVRSSLNRGGGLEVTLHDKSKYKATVVGTEESNDLALIKIDAPRSKLVPIPIGASSTLAVGQKVLAIGNPYGLEGTMTTGIISALGRSIEAQDGRIIENIIQTDAAINPGNSGGPLLNRSGEIIGINAAIVSPSNSGNVGIGFAIPADTVKRVVSDLKAHGFVRRPWLGVGSVISMDRFPEDLLQRLGISTTKGLMVMGVVPGGPAARAGMRPGQRIRYGYREYGRDGDILIAFEGKEITSAQQLLSQIDQHTAGDKLTFTIMRGNQKMDLTIASVETPPELR